MPDFRRWVGRVGFCGSAQFIVLGPQIALYDFGPRREPEKIRIAFTKCAFALVAFALVALVCLRFALGHR